MSNWINKSGFTDNVAGMADQGITSKRFDGRVIDTVTSFSLGMTVAMEKFDALIPDVVNTSNNYGRVEVRLADGRLGIGVVDLHEYSFSTTKRVKVYRMTYDQIPMHLHPEFRPGAGGTYEITRNDVWEAYAYMKHGVALPETPSDNLLEFVAKLGMGDWGYSEFGMAFMVSYFEENYTYDANDIGWRSSSAPPLLSGVGITLPSGSGSEWYSPGPNVATVAGTQWVMVEHPFWWKGSKWENLIPDMDEDIDSE